METAMKRVQQGFTLIELMIVVAIVGILAAIALPAYQDYIVRSKVSEAAATAAACKTSVAEYLASKNSMPTDITAAGCSSIASQYVTTTTVSGGTISVTVAAATGTTGDYILVPSQSGSAITAWGCTTSTVPAKYLPAVCRP